jgi:NAD(P)-dependent dehydrogenase (short-subunit alcohol dehydrogenase family)
LTTIKASAQTFLSKETKLHVLFNNAGVMTPPQGSKTAQGYELQLGTNTLAPFLFTKLLTPLIISTAASEPPNTVRVIWVSSSAAELAAPKGGLEISNLDYHKEESPSTKYGVSKAGNYFHAVEYARRYREQGVLSVALNPGNLKTDLARHKSKLFVLAIKWMVSPPIYGAYTEIFAAFSSDVKPEMEGNWGRFAGICFSGRNER